MKPATVLTFPTPQGVEYLFAQGWQPRQECCGLRLTVRAPLKNSIGGALTPTAAEVILWIAHCLGTLDFRYGEGLKHVPWSFIPGEPMRNFYRFMEEEAVQQDLTTGGTIAGGATAQKTFKLVLAFVSSKHRNVLQWLGETQMKSSKLVITEGASTTINANWARDTAQSMTIEVSPITRVSDPNEEPWGAPITVGSHNVTDLEVQTDDGLTLVVWDENAAQAATALTRYDCSINGEPEHIQVAAGGASPTGAASIADEYFRELDQGGDNIVDTVTVLYFLSKRLQLEEGKPGRVKIRQNQMDLASWKLRTFRVPVLDDAEMQEAAKLAAIRKGAPVLATRTRPPKSAHPGCPAYQGFRLIYQEHRDFHLCAGYLGTPDGQVRAVIPQHMVAKAAALVSAEGNAHAKDAAARSIQREVSEQFGAVTTSGQSGGPALATIRSTFAGVFNAAK